jgi:DNA-binding NarL/FixJ family response regulator
MYTGYSAFVIGSSTNANSVFNNPLFVTANISTPNFHLLSGSPSINAGNPSFIPSITEVDIDAELRANGIVDCGADEYYDKTTSTEILETAINNQYSVYPNPCTDFVDIKSNTINTEIKIYNAFGQVVLKTLIDTENQINIKYLPNGVYFIRFNNDTKQVLKLIKE